MGTCACACVGVGVGSRGEVVGEVACGDTGDDVIVMLDDEGDREPEEDTACMPAPVDEVDRGMDELDGTAGGIDDTADGLDGAVDGTVDGVDAKCGVCGGDELSAARGDSFTPVLAVPRTVCM